MDKLNEINKQSNLKEEKRTSGNSKGNFYTLESFENRHPYKFINVADLTKNRLDTELSHVESLGSSTMNNFSYYSNSEDSFNSYIDSELQRIHRPLLTSEEFKTSQEQAKSAEGQNQEDADVHQALKEEKELNIPVSASKEMVASAVSTTEIKPPPLPKAPKVTTFKEHAKKLNPNLPEKGEVCAI